MRIQERRLGDVLRVGGVAEDRVRVAVHLARMPAVEVVDGLRGDRPGLERGHVPTVPGNRARAHASSHFPNTPGRKDGGPHASSLVRAHTNPTTTSGGKTMRTVIGIVALLCVAVPAAFAAPPAGKEASQACKAQRNTIGMSAFRLLYAPTGKPKAAMDACLAQQVQVVTTEEKNAAKACKAERGTTTDSRTAFAEKYGTNANKKNAFGKCVSQTATEGVAEAQQATLNAAKACKEERGTTTASRTAFAEKYGTNANKKNAFGKCVSKLASTG